MGGPETLLIRARNADGTYMADDPSTPEDEAWATETNDFTGSTGGEV